jgi:PAS domain S-box-containing protein
MSNELTFPEQSSMKTSPDRIRLQSLLPQAARVAIIATDLTGTITYWNPFAEKLYGWSFEEVAGRNIMEITVSEETEEQAKQHMESVIAGNSWAGEFRVRSKDNLYVMAFVTLSPVRDEHGCNIGIVGVSEDLTARKEAEEAVRRSEEQFHAFANSLPELCWIARSDGYIFWFNDRWYEYTGTTPKQAEGWGWQSVHDPKVLPAVIDRWNAAIESGEPVEMEFPLRGVDGIYRWFLTRVRPVRGPDGKVVRWFGTNTNIDEQRQVLQSLSEARDSLEKRVQERTEELKTANDNLRELSVRLLRMRDDEQRRLARELHDSVGQLLVAIGMNIAIVSTEAHNLTPETAKRVAENAELVQEVSREIRTISHLLHPPLLDEAGLASAVRWYTDGFAERSNIKVELEIPSDFGRLPHDTEIAIFRIIQECLTNIHRHSGSTTAGIRIRRQGRRIEVQVEDSGKGIPQERQRELISSGRTGVGFGGMRQRLTQLGGTLEIHSDGKGTVVSAVVNIE